MKDARAGNGQLGSTLATYLPTCSDWHKRPRNTLQAPETLRCVWQYDCCGQACAGVQVQMPGRSQFGGKGGNGGDGGRGGGGPGGLGGGQGKESAGTSQMYGSRVPQEVATQP